MGTLGRIAGGFVLVGLVTVGGSAATSSGRAEQREPRILVDARMVQISDALWAKLGGGNAPVPPQKVTVPYASLLYALGEPNAVRIIASARAVARVGQTETVTTGEKMNYLLPTPDGVLEPRVTEDPIGTTLTIRPLDLREGKVLLGVKFVSLRVQRPQKVDPGSSLPIGPPMISTQTASNGGLFLTPGEPVIASGFAAPGLHGFTLIRAEVLAN
jgi:hypothetical protein